MPFSRCIFRSYQIGCPDPSVDIFDYIWHNLRITTWLSIVAGVVLGQSVPSARQEVFCTRHGGRKDGKGLTRWPVTGMWKFICQVFLWNSVKLRAFPGILLHAFTCFYHIQNCQPSLAWEQVCIGGLSRFQDVFGDEGSPSDVSCCVCASEDHWNHGLVGGLHVALVGFHIMTKTKIRTAECKFQDRSNSNFSKSIQQCRRRTRRNET